MAIQRPAPPARKKSGMGCLGCGCLIVILIILLLVGLVGGAIYLGFKQVVTVTSSAPAAIPAYNGTDDIYTGAQKKLADFNQAVGAGTPASLTLSADEINALLAHDPDLAKFQVRIAVSLDGDEARVQGSLPTDAIPYLGKEVPGRFFNLDTTFVIHFNDDTKIVSLDLHKAQLGDTTAPESSLAGLSTQLVPSLNSLLQKSPDCHNALAAAKTVEIKDGQFVIETK
jgi:flagellar basal body-associated protein FliL